MKAEVISEETAEKIQAYYKHRKGNSFNRLLAVFGIMGGLLIGLGIILILAHNWDDLSHPVKTVLAFVPMVVGQLLCVYTLARKQGSMAWREGSSAFLFLGVGIALSLVDQIYNVESEVSTLLFSWVLLGLPLIYVMGSSAASLLYIIGITGYGMDDGFFRHAGTDLWIYLLLLAAVAPHYYLLYRKNAGGNFMSFHNWMLPASVSLVLLHSIDRKAEFMFVSYMSLFGLFSVIGNLRYYREQKTIRNGFEIIGSLGSIVLLNVLSFDWFWFDLRRDADLMLGLSSSTEFILAVSITAIATLALIASWVYRKFKDISISEPVFLLFGGIFLLGLSSPVAMILVNILLFAIGVLTIWEGFKKNHLGLLNYGLLIVAVMIFCRFFDTDISFIIRGCLFVLVGAGFLAANVVMLKRRKKNGQ